MGYPLRCRATSAGCALLLITTMALPACRKVKTGPKGGATASSSSASASPESSASPTAQPEPALSKIEFVAERPLALGSFRPVEAGCSVDRIGDQPAEKARVSRDAQAAMVGWAGDMEAGNVPPVVLLELVGESSYFVPAFRGFARGDVAKALGISGLAGSGYGTLAGFANVAPGHYPIKVHQVSSTGDVTVCDPKRSVQVD